MELQLFDCILIIRSWKLLRGVFLTLLLKRLILTNFIWDLSSEAGVYYFEIGLVYPMKVFLSSIQQDKGSILIKTIYRTEDRLICHVWLIP